MAQETGQSQGEFEGKFGPPGAKAQNDVRIVGPGRCVIVNPETGDEHEQDWPCLRFKALPYQRDLQEAEQTGKYSVRIMHGATGSGKTYFAFYDGNATAQGLNRYCSYKPEYGHPLRMAVSILSMAKFEEYTRPDMERWFPTVDGQQIVTWSKEHKFWQYPNVWPFWGTQIFVKSQEQGLGSYESSTYNKFIFDEPHDVEYLEAAYGRVMRAKAGGKLVPGSILIVNSWLLGHLDRFWNEWIMPARTKSKPFIYERGDITMDDNTELDAARRAEAKKMYHGRDYIVRVMGGYQPVGSNPVLNIGILRDMAQTARAGLHIRVVKHERDGSTTYEPTPDKDSPLEVWEVPNMQDSYVLLVDVSEGVGKDDSAISVWRTRDAYQVAEYASADVQMVKFGSDVANIAHWYSDALVVILRKAVGAGLASIVKDSEKYGKLYRMPKRPDVVGLIETEDTKEQMVAEANTLLADNRWHIRSPKAIQQALVFVRNDKGTLGAQGGCKDDLAICAMTAIQFVRTGAHSALLRPVFAPGSLSERIAKIKENAKEPDSMFRVLRSM